MKHKGCMQCKFWDEMYHVDLEDDGPPDPGLNEPPDGWCKVNPPAIGDDGRGIWPVTSSDGDWCGKWEQASKELLDALGRSDR
ncbi:MAG: hypothetical protein K0S79_63 [Nitrospira sp.]|jgi:hypothetical protein|nr:hypothetical protein [Nitrospira sp.]